MHKEDHKQITKFVIDNFRESFSVDFQHQLKTYGSFLLGGAEVEDGKSPQRAKNWHFYKTEESIDFKPFFALFPPGQIQPSSRPRFKKLVTMLRRKHPSRTPAGFLKVAGRILHHIQDNSTPSHVLPIFHSPKSLWDEYPARDDTFENFSVKVIQDHLSKNLVTKLLNRGNTPPPELIDLYDQSARSSLVYLKSDDSQISVKAPEGEIVHIPNTIFWEKLGIDEATRRGFPTGWSDYGPYENRFGDEDSFEVPSEFVEEKKAVKICLHNYIHIYTYLVNKMAADSITALHLVENLANNPVTSPIGYGDE